MYTKKVFNRGVNIILKNPIHLAYIFNINLILEGGLLVFF